MDRYHMGEWLFESNQGPIKENNEVNVYENSYISFQNHKAGISYEFHTYEALELANPAIQDRLLHESGELTGNHVSFKCEDSELICCSSYKGRVKPIHMHGQISIQPCLQQIPFDKLSSKDPILWFSEIMFFSKSNLNEKAAFSMKVRVMPSCFYALARMSVNSNRKFIRALETRIFHSFDEEYIIRNFSVKENSFEELLKKGMTPRNGSIEEEIFQSLDKTFSFCDQISLSSISV